MSGRDTLYELADVPRQLPQGWDGAEEVRLTVKQKTGEAWNPATKRMEPTYQGLEVCYRRNKSYRMEIRA